MVKLKDISRPRNVFEVLFKAYLIFKDFSRVLYIQVLFKPVRTLSNPSTGDTALRNSFKNTSSVNNLDPDQAQPDLDPNFLQRLSVDDNGGQRVNPNYILRQAKT